MFRRLILAASIALAAAPAAADTAAVRRTYLERVAISAADQHCNLFSEGERLALKSGIYQAEGELLRARESPAELQRVSAEVTAHARKLGCAHPDIVSVAATIRNSYRQFVKTSYLEYPTQRSVWGASRSEHDKWAVSQTDKVSGYVFGLRRVPGKPDQTRLAVAMPAGGLTPSSVHLLLRDPAKMPEPWFGAFSSPGAKLTPPPRSIARIEWAGKVMSAKDPEGDPIWIFTFGPDALALLETLDPREAVQIDFLPSERAGEKKVKQVVFEIGDLRAARAFSMIPRIDLPPAAQTAAADH